MCMPYETVALCEKSASDEHEAQADHENGQCEHTRRRLESTQYIEHVRLFSRAACGWWVREVVLHLLSRDRTISHNVRYRKSDST